MSSNRSPFVPMRTDLVKDERVQFIADLCGYSRDEVLGRLFRMWAWCTDRKLEDAPDDCPGYAVHEAIIRRFMGPYGVQALLGDGCAELALGDRRHDGLIFLHGTETVVASLRGLYRRAHAGGLARAAEAQRDGGRFVRSPTDGPATESALATDHPDPDPDLREREGARARSIEQAGPAESGSSARIEASIVPAMSPPASRREDKPRTPRMDKTVQSTPAVYDPEDPAHRGGLAASVYKRVSDARVAVAAELGLPEQLPFPIVAPSSRAGSFRELLDRVREEGAAAPAACARVVDNLIAQAREERTIEWLAEKAFTSGAWRTARGWVSKKLKAKPRAAAAAAEQRPAEPPLSADEIAELAELAKRIGANPDAAAAGERARFGPARAARTDDEMDEHREATS